jgi:hypothetical protein
VFRASLAVSAVVVLLLAVAGAAFGHNSAAPKLKGTVGPGFTINLTKSGQKVKVVKAGSYLFVIADKSSFHNFTLERQTGVSDALCRHDRKGVSCLRRPRPRAS